MVSFNHDHRVQSDESSGTPSADPQNLSKFKVRVTYFDDLMIQAGVGPALTPLGHLVLDLLTHGPMPVRSAFQRNPLSYRSFYNMLNKLKTKGIVSIEADNNDRRIRRLVLNPEFALIETYLGLC